MGCHLLIALSRHSEKDVLMYCLSVLLMSFYLVGTFSPEVSKPKKGSLEGNFGVY